MDPATGKPVTLESHARLQERSLALDDREALRRLYKKQKELEAILDDDSATEPEKAEALTELENLYHFQRSQAARSTDAAHRAAKSARMAISRVCRRLASATGPDGAPHPAIRSLASHLTNYILTSSQSAPGSLQYRLHSAPLWTP